MRDDWAQSRRRWIICIGLVMSLIAWKISVLMKFELHPLAAKIGMASLAFLWAKHALGQTVGINLLYNCAAKTQCTPPERSALAVFEKRERILLGTFVMVGVATRLNSHMKFYPITRLADAAITLVLLFLALTIIALSFRFSGPAFRRKRIFLLRLLLYPMIFWSPLAAVALNAIHGTEYLMLSSTMAWRSRSPWARALPFILPLLGFVLILPAFTAMFQGAAIRMFGTTGLIPRRYLVPMILFFFTLENLHYYFDSFLYRMRDPAVRKNILPLLVPGSGIKSWT